MTKILQITGVPLLLLFLFSANLSAQKCIEGDCINGYGVLEFNSGTVYEGNFKNSKFHGYGVCHYIDGAVYKGQWKDQYQHGEGVYTTPEGDVLKGDWVMGDFKTQLKGEAHIRPQETASGCISGNCFDGEGVFRYSNGARYEGGFSNGRLNGQGTWYHLDGSIFTGAFLNGLRHGHGVVQYTNGQKQTGFWVNGAYVGTEPTSSFYQDCNSVDCGDTQAGRFVYENGTVYTGQFKNGLPHGEGFVEYADGSTYEGGWINGQPNGYGTFTDPKTNKSSYGLWKDNELTEFMPSNKETITDAVEHDPEVKVWAVVVGVSSYVHMPALTDSDNDAFHFLAFLKSPEGGAVPDKQISILIDEDATQQNIIASMKELFGKADDNDLIVLYFSGHGLNGAFLPIDYDGYQNKLMHQDVQAIFKNSQAKHKLCIADACHSGSYGFQERGSGRDAESMVQGYYDNLSVSNGGMALLLSSKPQESSVESMKMRQGVFSHFLLKGMKGEADNNGDKVVNITELFSYMQEEVRKYTKNRQTPVLKGQFDSKMPISVVRED